MQLRRFVQYNTKAHGLEHLLGPTLEVKTVKKLTTLAAATVGLATIAAAQTDSLNNITIRGGIAFPTSADLGGTFIGAGIDFDFGKSLFGGKGSTYFSFDWLSKSTQGTRGNLFPIMLNQKFMLQDSEVETAMPLYAFVGAGLCVIDAAPAATVLAGRFGLGAVLNPNFSIEGAFVITGRARTSNIIGNHIGLYLGYKF